jgi:hypothetical protein
MYAAMQSVIWHFQAVCAFVVLAVSQACHDGNSKCMVSGMSCALVMVGHIQTK